MPSENWFDCRSSSTRHCYLSLITLSVLCMLFWVKDLRGRKTKLLSWVSSVLSAKQRTPNSTTYRYKITQVQSKRQRPNCFSFFFWEKPNCFSWLALSRSRNLLYYLKHYFTDAMLSYAWCGFSYLYYYYYSLYKMLKLLAHMGKT